MKPLNPTAEIFVPDGTAETEALRRITHLGIGAHQDDLEFMALHGILACHGREDRWFGGVTCTDGGGSARVGPFADYTDDQMKTVRQQEQNRAAELGGYGAMIQLGYPSATIRDPASDALQRDLTALLEQMTPHTVYTHNPADKHATHVAVTVNVIRVLRSLPPARRPRAVYGCETWRDLDWMDDREKVLLDVSGNERLAAELSAVFQSQIAGGKRYDRAVEGRRRANATFFDSYAADQATHLWFAMDLTPLIGDDTGDETLLAYVEQRLDGFCRDVRGKLKRQLGLD